MKKILKCISVLVIILSVLIMICTTAYVIKIKSNPVIVPGFFGYKPLVVLTGSMEPYIKAGDMIFVKGTNINELGIGDIITYNVGGNTYITHRIKEKLSKGDKVILKAQGDANNQLDNVEIYEDMLIGKVSFIIPKAGYAMQFAKSFKGFILLIVIPIFILLLEQAFIIIAKIQGDKKRRYRKHNNFRF